MKYVEIHKKEIESSTRHKYVSKIQSYQSNKVVESKFTAYLECSYLDSGTLDVRLVYETLVFCSALLLRHSPHYATVRFGGDRAFSAKEGCNILG